MQAEKGGTLRGAAVIAGLAEVFEQLYLAPGEAGEQAYRKVVLEGEHPAVRTRAHFRTSPDDLCRFVETPAGEIRVITLAERADFETFLQIIAHRCKKVSIPATQGASFLNGVINRRKIDAHREVFFRKAQENGGTEPDAGAWSLELKQFISDKKNYTEAMIILSVGPYSNVPAEKAGYPAEDWLRLSDTIRTYHECTHYVCRCFYPELIDAVWDEAVADAVGITAAFGSFDARLEELFLGIENGRYKGGRLENYVPETETDRETRVQALAARVHGLMERIASLPEAKQGNGDPFALIKALEERKAAFWG